MGKRVSSEELVADIRQTADKLDQEYLTADEYDRRGEYNKSTPIDRFGSWNAAVREAGLEVAHKAHRNSKETLLADLRRVADSLNQDHLTTTEYEDKGNHGVATITRRLGSWNDALREAGLTPFQKKNIEPEDILRDLRRVADDTNGNSVIIPEYETHGDYGINTIAAKFGSWTNAVRKAGFTPATEITDEELLIDLRRIANETVGDILLKSDYKEHGEYSPSTALRRFGTWDEVVEKVGATSGDQKIPDEDLFADLRRVADEIDRRCLTKADYDERGKYSASTITARFESWGSAVKEAGLLPVSQWYGTTEQPSWTQLGRSPNECKIAKEDLLIDLRRVANKIEGDRIKARDYDQEGKYSTTTVIKQLESWINAVEKVGYKSHIKRIATEDLKHSLQNVGSEDEAPTSTEYAENGKYHYQTVIERFGSWSNAVQAAGYTSYSPPRTSWIPSEELIASIQTLSSEDEPPTSIEYDESGKFGTATVVRRFGTWANALQEAGYTSKQIDRLLPYTDDVEDEELLRELRRLADGEVGPTAHTIKTEGEYSTTPYFDRFGTIWQSVVCAGLKPYSRTPVTKTQYVDFIETVLDYGHPTRQLTGLLLAFTGLGTTLTGKFSTKWIVNLNTSEETAIRVPKEHLQSDEDWILKVPSKWHNPETNQQETTHIEGLLNWAVNHEQELYSSTSGVESFLSMVNESIGIEGSRESHLTMTLGTHLAERGAPPWFIQKQTGVGFRGMDAKVEDFYLWNYVHQGINHPDYNPPDVVLNPTGRIID